jgi:hypothetical protein
MAFMSLIGILTSCSDFNKHMGWKDDNPVEKAAEFVIKEEAGIDIDLTPEQKEILKKSADQKEVPKKDKKIDG